MRSDDCGWSVRRGGPQAPLTPLAAPPTAGCTAHRRSRCPRPRPRPAPPPPRACGQGLACICCPGAPPLPADARPHLLHDVPVLCMHLGHGSQVPDDAEDLVHLGRGAHAVWAVSPAAARATPASSLPAPYLAVGALAPVLVCHEDQEGVHACSRGGWGSDAQLPGASTAPPSPEGPGQAASPMATSLWPSNPLGANAAPPTQPHPSLTPGRSVKLC